MKSQLQVFKFLSKFTPASQLDADMITGFLEKYYKITPTTTLFSSTPAKLLISAQQFLFWYAEGYAEGEIVIYDGQPALLGNSLTETPLIIAVNKFDRFQREKLSVESGYIGKADKTQKEQLLSVMFEEGLEYSFEKSDLIKKYIPEHDERVVFHKYDYSENGVGVVRSIDKNSGRVEMYCYYVYPTKNSEARFGYSMHETEAVDLKTYNFEPISDKSFEYDTNGYSCLKKLNSELGKAGKVWKDRVHRVEPLHMGVEVGQPYWYISDQFKLVKAIEKGTPLSHRRMLAGNYFVDIQYGLEALNFIMDSIQKYLASPEWPITNF